MVQVADGSPDQGPEREPAPQASEVHKVDRPSSFVARVLDSLRNSLSESDKSVLEQLRQQGVFTPRELAAFVESKPAEVCSLLIRAYRVVLERSSKEEIAEGVPALISLAYQILCVQRNPHGSSERDLFKVISHVLRHRPESNDLAANLGVCLSAQERHSLALVVRNASVNRRCYWSVVELLCTLYPDMSSLHVLIEAIDRLPSGVPRGAAFRAVRLSVAAVAERTFQEAFELLGRSVCDPAHPSRHYHITNIATALLGAVREQTTIFSLFLISPNQNIRFFAYKVTILLGRDDQANLLDEEPGPLPVELAQLANTIRRNLELRDHVDQQIPVGLALAALASISPRLDDINSAKKGVLECVRTGVLPRPELCDSIMYGLARTFDFRPWVALRSLSEARLNQLLYIPVRQSFGRPPDHAAASVSKPSHLTEVALALGDACEFGTVRTLLTSIDKIDRSSLQTPRPLDSLEIFPDPTKAAHFLRHFRALCKRGELRYVVMLFPEFLSALAAADEDLSGDFGDADKSLERSRSVKDALNSMTYMSTAIAGDSDMNSLAVARLNHNDWEFLFGLPLECKLDTSLSLATFALLAALGGPARWQEAVRDWRSGLDGTTSWSRNAKALARLSIAAERTTPDSARSLLETLSLKNFESQDFRSIAYACLVNPTRYSRWAVALVRSPDAFNMARGFFLAQLLRKKLTENQAMVVLEVARASVVEPGVLSLDAVCSVGALSRSVEDAELLLQSEPATGVGANEHTATVMGAVANISRNAGGASLA